MRHPEELVKYLHKFKQVKDYPIPEDVKITAFYSMDEDGFIENLTTLEIGLTLLGVKSWILQTDIDYLFNT